MSLQDFTIEFEDLHHNLNKYDINLPEAVTAYRYLNRVNLSNQQKEIVRPTIPDLKYQLMVDQVKKVYNDISGG